MNRSIPHNKLQVHYRLLHQGETTTVWIAGTTPGDTVTELWPAWRAMTRIQWLPSWFKGEQLEWALLRLLRCSHPMAEDVALDRITTLREEVVLLKH